VTTLSAAAPDAAQLDTLTRINLGDVYEALGLAGQRRGRTLLDSLFWLPARHFAKQVIHFDNLIGERGLPAAAEWLIRLNIHELQVAGREHVPEHGPTLLLSNHPGLTDTLAAFIALNRDDLLIIARERPFTKALPHINRKLIYVPDDSRGRVSPTRTVLHRLREGATILTCPAGRIEPDPAVMDDAMASLEDWAQSISFFARAVPELKIVPMIISGVFAPGALRNPLTRLRRTRAGREHLAAMLQVLWPGYRRVAVRVAIGPALLAKDLLAAKLDPTRATIEAARALIEHPPTRWQTLVTGAR
jgi:1-acyl-sn-glycerol-3-phosphate acyltransferase